MKIQRRKKREEEGELEERRGRGSSKHRAGQWQKHKVRFRQGWALQLYPHFSVAPHPSADIIKQSSTCFKCVKCPIFLIVHEILCVLIWSLGKLQRTPWGPLVFPRYSFPYSNYGLYTCTHTPSGKSIAWKHYSLIWFSNHLPMR